jgi:hypothetical protein
MCRLSFYSGIGSGFNDLVNPGPVFESDFYNKKVCFESGSVLDPDSMALWIRIEQQCCILIRIEVNPDPQA